MTTEKSTLPECVSVNITGHRITEWHGKNATQFDLEISGPNGSMEIPFHHGFAIKGDPDPLGIIKCLLMDTDSGEMDFPEFCSEFGYDQDSRKAHATWTQCRGQGEELRRAMGAEMIETLRELTADL